MSLANPLAYVLLMLVIFGTSQLIVSKSAFFQTLASAPGGRFGSLDGFRGLLASGVFIHHAVVNFGYAQSGSWQKPSARLYEALGGDCVLYFFMITGLLFWTKCIKGGARIDAKNLIASRIKRIMPAYLASAALVFAAVAIASRFELRVEPSALLSSVARWLLGGLFGSPEVNGISPKTINGAVTWTLQYEWFFYLALPLVAYFATLRRFPLLLLSFAVLAYAIRHFGLGISSGLVGRFIVGMAIAHLTTLRPVLRQASGAVGSVVVLGCLVTAAALPVPRALAAVLMCIAFTGIAYGNDLFGLLRTRPAVFLGQVSYSIYLLHCIVLYVAIHCLPTGLRGLSTTQFWLFCAPVAVLVVFAGALSYRLFEHPFLNTRPPEARPATDVQPVG